MKMDGGHRLKRQSRRTLQFLWKMPLYKSGQFLLKISGRLFIRNQQIGPGTDIVPILAVHGVPGILRRFHFRQKIEFEMGVVRQIFHHAGDRKIELLPPFAIGEVFTEWVFIAKIFAGSFFGNNNAVVTFQGGFRISLD